MKHNIHLRTLYLSTAIVFLSVAACRAGWTFSSYTPANLTTSVTPVGPGDSGSNALTGCTWYRPITTSAPSSSHNSSSLQLNLSPLDVYAEATTGPCFIGSRGVAAQHVEASVTAETDATWVWPG